MVCYQKGEFYAEHYDNKAGGAVARAATIIVYLEDTAKGGATFFPRCAPTRTDMGYSLNASTFLRDTAG